MTTLTDFYYALSRVSVTGVVRNFEWPPDSLATADLPALWVELPDADNGGESAWASACDGTGKARTARLILAIEPAGQDNAQPNTRAVVTMMDRLETALDALGYPLITYILTGGEPIGVSQTAYWGVTATVTIRG